MFPTFLSLLLKDPTAFDDQEASEQGQSDEEYVDLITEDGFVFHLEMYLEGRYMGWVQTSEGPVEESFSPEEFTRLFFKDS